MPEKLKYSLVMFLAGSCYGFVVPLVRIAQSEGFNTGEIMVTQYVVAVTTLALGCLLFSRIKVGWKNALKLMGIGVVAAAVSFCYYHSLARLSPATSLTLLFQFVWMGTIVESVRTRKLPQLGQVFTVLLVVFGAVLATGILDEDSAAQNLDILGVIFGLLSAACYTAFLVLAGRVSPEIPAVNRSLFTAIGSVIVSLAICPTYLENPLIVIDPFIGMAQGIVGICAPVFLISLSSPKLPAGLATVMASSELPSGVLCAAVFLREPITFFMGVGVVIVLMGIVISERESLLSLIHKSKPAQAPTDP